MWVSVLESASHTVSVYFGVQSLHNSKYLSWDRFRCMYEWCRVCSQVTELFFQNGVIHVRIFCTRKDNFCMVIFLLLFGICQVVIGHDIWQRPYIELTWPSELFDRIAFNSLYFLSLFQALVTSSADQPLRKPSQLWVRTVRGNSIMNRQLKKTLSNYLKLDNFWKTIHYLSLEMEGGRDGRFWRGSHGFQGERKMDKSSLAEYEGGTIANWLRP